MLRFLYIILFLSVFVSNAFALISFKQSKVITSDSNQIRGINFKPDGTIMYVTERQANPDTVLQYSLSVPFDVSTATLSSQTSIHPVVLPHVIVFKPDGTRMFIVNNTGTKIEQFSLSTPWQTSSLNHEGTYNVSGENQLRTITFKPDGTRFYVTGENNNIIKEYTLDNPWDVTDSSAVTNTANSASHESVEDNPRNLQFHPDGTVLYLAGNETNAIKKYTLKTAWDITSSSLEFSQSYSLTGQLSNMRGFIFTANFTKLYVTDDINDGANTVFEYSVSCAGTITCSNPTNDSDVKAIVEAQVELSKRIIKHNTLPVFHRIEWLRRHKNKDNLSNLNAQIDFTNKKVSRLVKGLKSLKKNNTGNLNEEDWYDWSEGRISFGKGKAGTSSSKDIHSYGFSIGTDRINEEDQDAMYGYVFQYGNDHVDIGSSGTKLNTDSYSISRYSTKLRDNNTFTDGIIGFSLLDIHHNRVTYANILTGDREGKQIFGSVNLGKRLNDEKLNLNPGLKIDLGYTEFAAFTENTILGDSQSDALVYKKQKVKSALATIGILLDKTNKRDDDKLINHHGRIEYIADLSPSSDAKFYYANSQSTIYKYTVDNKAKHNYRIGYGFDTTSISGWSIVANLERFRANGKGHSNEFYLSLGYVPIDEFKFALHLNYNENLNTGINIVKNFNGFDLKFNIDANMENNNHNSNILINKSF